MASSCRHWNGSAVSLRKGSLSFKTRHLTFSLLVCCASSRSNCLTLSITQLLLRLRLHYIYVITLVAVCYWVSDLSFAFVVSAWFSYMPDLIFYVCCAVQRDYLESYLKCIDHDNLLQKEQETIPRFVCMLSTMHSSCNTAWICAWRWHVRILLTALARSLYQTQMTQNRSLNQIGRCWWKLDVAGTPTLSLSSLEANVEGTRWKMNG